MFLAYGRRTSTTCRITTLRIAAVLPVVILAMSLSSSSVPARMVLSKALAGSLPDLYEAPMISLILHDGTVEQDKTVGPMRLEDVAKSFGKNNNECRCSVAFVVRRPG